jgi:glucose-1-phosphate thymidylyltransferase
MKAIVLAAGYGTRLRPLTDTLPKELLHVGGRPIIDRILDRVADVAAVDEVHVVTNASKIDAFEAWAAGRDVTLHDDLTTSNDDRLGAIGDVRFVVERAGLGDDDLLVVAGDNLFEFSLAEYVAFWREKGQGSAIAVHELADPSLASLYGVVELDPDDRIVGLEEKPERPRSALVSTATYLFSREHVAALGGYLDAGHPADPPGRFIEWLVEREPVYGFRFSEEWLDIGDHTQLLEADNRYRVRAGLPERSEYTPGPTAVGELTAGKSAQS